MQTKCSKNLQSKKKHAEREGKIFNKHIPPEGGNPGEDYNCRCWAEPYDGQEYKNKPMVIDVSGLEIFKELKPVDFTTAGLPQYAANDKANAASDAGYKRKPLSNNDLDVSEISISFVEYIMRKVCISLFIYRSRTTKFCGLQSGNLT